MSGLELKYKLDMSRLQGTFKRLEDLDTSQLMEEIGAYQLSETQRNFKKSRTPEGDRWDDSQAALQRALSGKKTRKGKTLIASGLLLKSYVSEADRRSVVIGSNRVYAAIHHFGFDGQEVVKSHNRLIKKAFGRRLRGPTWQTVDSFTRNMKMPARPALGITDDDLKEYDRIAKRFVSRYLAGGLQ